MTTLDKQTLGSLPAAKRELLQRRLRGTAAAASAIPPHSEHDRAPLSGAQRGLWILDHYVGPIGLYNIHLALWLDGTLEVAALSQALDDIVQRHQVLRAHTPVPGTPVQVFRSARPGMLEVIDLADVPVAGRRARALSLAGEAAARPFDLARGPLIGALLLRLTGESHLLVLTMHHLVCDEHSMEILRTELGTAYTARRHGQAADLPRLPVQYRDYAAWQATRRDDSHLAYWRDALADLPGVLDLPADSPRPAVPSHQGGRVHLDLGAEIRDQVAELAGQLSCTTFAVLLSTFAAVVHRYSGMPRIAVGTLLAGRTRTEVEDLIGLFSHPAALLADFTDDPAFSALVTRMHLGVGGALANQDVTFEDVVDAVRPDRDLSANPLFQVLYQHEDRSGPAWELPGLEVEEVDLGQVQAKVDLALFTADDGTSVVADLVFATDIFTLETSQRMLRHFRRLLTDALHDPGQRVSRLQLLSVQERATQLYVHNETYADYPRDACLHELFEAQVDRTPGATALRGPGLRVSFRELDQQANRLARRLRELGVRADTPVGICMEHGPGMFAALFGVVKAGGAYVPLDPAHPADRLAYVLADTKAQVVITEDRLVRLLPEGLPHVIKMDRDAAELRRYPSGRLGRTCHAENLVYIMYTSGSTGRPKGVMISHRGLNNYLCWAVDGFGLNGAHGAPMVGSIAFDLSVPNFFVPLIDGKDVTLLPPDPSQQALAELLAEPGDFSLLKITPAHLDVLRGQLMARPGARVESVRTFVVGADEVKPETVTGWRRLVPDARLVNEYGPTETVVGCSAYDIPVSFDPARPISIGLPNANMTMYVLDQQLEPVPPGVIGELYIGGEGVGRGYLGMPGLTADKFVPDPFSLQPGSRFYRSGDRARARPDGNVEFLGRLDHQVKIRGYRIELGEIEAQLLLDPAVREAVVTVREDQPGLKTLAAYLVPASPEADPVAVRQMLRKSLPDYMVPSVIVLLDELPLSAGGKVDRRLLPVPDRSARAGTAVPPRNDQERLLAWLWSELLDVPVVGVTDNFFELGGDSLLAIQLVIRARSHGLNLTPRLVFQHQAIEALARAAAEPAGAEPAGAEPAEVPLSPSQARLLSSGTPHEYHVPVVVLEVRSPVPVGDLERALHDLVARHQALRLRMDGNPRRLSAVRDEPARLLRTVSAPRAGLGPVAEALRRDLSLTAGPLLQAALIQDDGTERLMLAAHHFAVDGVSWEILLDELATLWPGLGGGPLPPPGPALGAWTRRLHDLAWSAELADEARYWQDLEWSPSIPVDYPGGQNTADTARTVRVALSGEQTAALRRTHRAGLAELGLSALSVVLTGWTGRPSVTVEMAGHGRGEPLAGIDPSRTVGWLSCDYPVTLRCHANDDAALTLADVSRLLRDVPRAGLGYGLLRFLRDDDVTAGLRDRPAVDIRINYQASSHTGGQPGTPFVLAPDGPDVEAAGAGRRTHLLEVTAAVLDGRLTAGWTYSARVHDERTIRRLADDWLRVLQRWEAW